MSEQQQAKMPRKIWSLDAKLLDQEMVEREQERLQHNSPYRRVTTSDALRSLIALGAQALKDAEAV